MSLIYNPLFSSMSSSHAFFYKTSSPFSYSIISFIFIIIIFQHNMHHTFYLFLSLVCGFINYSHCNQDKMNVLLKKEIGKKMIHTLERKKTSTHQGGKSDEKSDVKWVLSFADAFNLLPQFSFIIAFTLCFTCHHRHLSHTLFFSPKEEKWGDKSYFLPPPWYHSIAGSLNYGVCLPISRKCTQIKSDDSWYDFIHVFMHVSRKKSRQLTHIIVWWW